MSGTIFFILLKFKKITTLFTGIVGGLFLGMFFSITVSAIANWNSFYMMAFIMGISATISLGASWFAKQCPDCEMDPLGLKAAKMSKDEIEVGCQDKDCKIHLHTFQLATSCIIGAFITMRGWALCLGGYPTESQLFNMWYQETWDTSNSYSIEWTFWVYNLVFVLQTILFWINTTFRLDIVQKRVKKDKKKQLEEKLL
jgi:hypothetical protein